MLIYNIEIKRCILSKNEKPMVSSIVRDDWKNHGGMGVSCICCYDYQDDRYRVFLEDNKADFALLVAGRKIIVGFNNLGFDNKVLAHEGVGPYEQDLEYLNKKSYDIFKEILFADGGWCNLDALVKTNNLATGKTGNGALAPVWYQEGRIGKLVDYCLTDVWLIKKLFDKILKDEMLISSKTGQAINIRKP